MNTNLNPLKIPHLSQYMKRQIFKNPQIYNENHVRLSKKHLELNGLLDKEEITRDINFRLPTINNSTLDFELLGREQLLNIFGDNYDQIETLLRFKNTPEIPRTFSKRAGWTCYKDGTDFAVDCPLEDLLVFDVEVMYKISPYPVIATCLSETAWYSWVSPQLFNGKIPSELISFGDPTKYKMIIGHNVSYDRARIKEEYHLKKSNFNFIDTLSLHVSVAGFCNAQRALYMQKNKTMKSLIHPSEQCFSYESDQGSGIDKGTMNSLKDVAKFYLNEQVEKSDRDYFGQESLDIFQDEELFQKLMRYCAKDVQITAKLYQILLPRFKEKCPHPVSFSGMLHLSKGLLPTTKRWKDYLNNCRKMYEKNQILIENELIKVVDETLQLSPEEINSNQWLNKLDWTVKPTLMTKEKVSSKGVILHARPYANTNLNLLGKPNWYRKLWDSKLNRVRVSLSMNVVPYLLQLQWKNYPIRHCTQNGWLYHMPLDDASTHESKPIIEEDFPDRKSYRIPHPSGEGKNCGNPLSKMFVKYFESGTISSPRERTKELLKLYSLGTYWSSAHDRLEQQFVKWDGDVGAIVPNLLPFGTITRRAVEPTWLTAPNAKSNSIGSEVKSMIEAPKGYSIVGADVDSQELWIASLYGDSYLGMHGATAIGYMTLQGTKANGTDLHSVTGNIVGISRDVAKIFNYSRIYGAGEKYASELIRKFVGTAENEARRIAKKLFRKTKGIKVTHNGNSYWTGGSESLMFNQLESVATRSECRTPCLGSQIPDTLIPSKKLGRNFLTSRINWAVQSSAVDYLHLLLVAMDYLIRRMKIDGRFMISIHDEIRYIIKDEDVDKACLALQISNLWVRSFFSIRAGINDLPMNVAFFSAVDVDKVLRKEVNMDCLTPSNPNKVPHGYTQTIDQTLERVFKGEQNNNIYGDELPSITRISNSYTANESWDIKSQALEVLNEFQLRKILLGCKDDTLPETVPPRRRSISKRVHSTMERHI